MRIERRGQWLRLSLLWLGYRSSQGTLRVDLNPGWSTGLKQLLSLSQVIGERDVEGRLRGEPDVVDVGLTGTTYKYICLSSP